MPLIPGTTLAGRWQIQKLISRHSYLLFSAVDLKDEKFQQREVMLKAINYPPSPSPEKVAQLRQAFVRQLNVLSLGHYRLPEPLDFFTITNDYATGVAGTPLASDEPILVYTFSPGNCLLKHIRHEGCLPAVSALYLVHQIAEFLCFLQDEGWVFLGINPSHFIWKESSFRIVGLSNFFPFNKTTNVADKLGDLALPHGERAYLPLECLKQGSFGPAAQYYGLCLLYYFAVTGVHASRIAKEGKPSPGLFNSLPIAPEIREAFTELLAASQREISAQEQQLYTQRLASLIPVQKTFDRAQRLEQVSVALFADYDALFTKLRQRISRPGQQPFAVFPFDLEAIAYSWARHDPNVYKMVLVSERYYRRPEIADLDYDGWDIVQTPVGASLSTEVVKFLRQSKPRHITLLAHSFPRELANVLHSLHIQFCFIGPDQLKDCSLADRSNIEDLLCQIGLSASDYSDHKHLIWELLIQTGDRGKTLELLKTLHFSSKGQSLVTRLARWPVEFQPFLARLLLASDDPVSDAINLSNPRFFRSLQEFSPAPPELLEKLYTIGLSSLQRLERLATFSAALVSEWEFFRKYLDSPHLDELLELYLRVGAANFKAVTGEIAPVIRLINTYGVNKVASLLSEHGLAALQIVDQYGPNAVKAISLFQGCAVKILGTDEARGLLSLIENDTLLAQAKRWFWKYGNLKILAILLRAPQLFPLAYDFGEQTVYLFSQGADVSVIKQAAVISNRTGLSLADAAKLRSCLPHIREEVLMGIISRHRSLFKKGNTLDDCAHTINAIFQVQRRQNGKFELALLELLSRYGSLAARTYLRWHEGILQLVEQLSPDVMPLLDRFPGFYPALQCYGEKAFDFLKAFDGEAERLTQRLMETSHLDVLESWLSGALLDLLSRWYQERGTLAPVYWANRHPQLLALFQSYGYNAALAFEAVSRYSHQPLNVLAEHADLLLKPDFNLQEFLALLPSTPPSSDQ